ncbi:MAG: hypothetical protein IJ012_01540 [Clostridia bacterium]|nr:hypothetical protein [Clostridia bacterium]
MKAYRIIASIFATLVIAVTAFLSIDLFGVDLSSEDVSGDMVVKALVVEALPQLLVIILCILDRRLYFIPSFASRVLCDVVAGAGAHNLALVLTMLLPYICALLAIFATRVNLKGLFNNSEANGLHNRTIAEYVGEEWFHWTKD